jgi:hypothetical protein
VIILTHFNVWWDNEVNGCLEKTLIIPSIPRLLQPAGNARKQNHSSKLDSSTANKTLEFLEAYRSTLDDTW